MILFRILRKQDFPSSLEVKGSHRKYRHSKFNGAIILSGGDNDDARAYQEKQVRNAISEAMK
jgi:predicted RNA binding protein YcfA (HicA-like mRNA interferase family)